jgi:hypothetical protein
MSVRIVYEKYPGQFDEPDRVEADAEHEMMAGYFDGKERDAITPTGNRSEAYLFGWKNGRDDRLSKPRSSAAELKDEWQEILSRQFN